jgi:membrane-associated phospholipid phosphatase
LRDPSGSIFTLRLVLSLALFALLSLVDAGVRVDRRGWSLGRLGAELRRRWPKDRVIVAVSGLVAYHIVYACYRNLKSWVAFRHPMDDQLLRVDKALLGGHSPAVLLHDLLGQHVAAHVFAVIYESFSYLVPVSFVAALVFANRIREGYVFLSSAIWVWILGLGTYYLVPSLGPFASASRDFAGLDHTRITATQAQYMAERAQLLSHPAAGDSFASISAFASLHVGFTCMILLMLRYYGFSRAARVMTVYLVAVMVSTIYLGWHFMVDDVAGVVLAWAAVLLGRVTIHPRHRQKA